MVWEKLSWGVPYENRLVITRAVQGLNKGIYDSIRCIYLVLLLYLSILRCDSGIIKLFIEIFPLGSLTVWQKLDFKDRPEWPDGWEGPDQTGRGRDVFNDGWML